MQDKLSQTQAFPYITRPAAFESLESRRMLASVPAGFTTSLLASGITSPTALEQLPDGRLIILQQSGRVQLFDRNTQQLQEALRLSVDSLGERGLLGVAADPAFATNGFLYLYYTVPGTPAGTGPATSPFNRISRFTLQGNSIAPSSEVILLDQPALGTARSHNGGAMHFATDGKLLVAIGDNVQPARSQATDSLLGKVIRINPDGTIPTDNPFFNTTTGINRAIFATGFRNPFTFAVDRATGRTFVNDVGQVTSEEINELFPGANYGWPDSEGPTTQPGITSPIFSYGRETGAAIVGGTFYSPQAPSFPPDFAGDYLFADFAFGFIKRFDISNAPITGSAVTDFATDFNGIVDLDVTPTGDLLVLSRGDSGGSVTRIQATPTTPNQPAVLRVSAPATSFKYTAGKPLTISATARDPETGKVPASSIAYRLDALRGTQVLPVATSTGSRARFLIPQPDPADRASTTLQYRITVTATDAAGDTTTFSRTYNPRLLTVRVTPSLPRGATGTPAYALDGTPIDPSAVLAGRFSFTSIAGVSRELRIINSPDDNITLRRLPGTTPGTSTDTLLFTPTSSRTIRPVFRIV
jgi:glucose/arabinose dehydrogenase